MKKTLKIAALCSILALVLLAAVSCNSFGKHNHAFGDWATVKDATCTEKGLQERTCSCGEKETQEINALGHTEVADAAVASTCTTDGLTAGSHCSTCGEIFKAQEVIPAEHNWMQLSLLEPATCFTYGEERRSCRVCGVVENAPVAPLAHDFALDEETQYRTCTLCNGVLFVGHLYVVFEGEYHWFDAYKACEDMGGHLVTITSAREQEVLTDIMNSELRSATSYWMGGVRVSGAFKWVTEEPFEYTHWEKKQPNFYDDNQYFMNTYSYRESALVGYWNDYEPTFRFGFICEWELGITECEHTFTEWEITTEATCWNGGEQYRICTYCGVEETEALAKLEHNFVLNEEIGIEICEYCNGAKYNGHIYVLFTDVCSWFDAASRCNVLGGHLATITSESEQEFIISYLNTFDFSKAPYVGAYTDGNQWRWVTDEPFEYTNWKSGEPSNSSGVEWVMHIGYKNNVEYTWNDLHPEDRYSYLCEFEYE